MPLLLCLLCFAFIAITNGQKKKKQKIAAQPGIERRSLNGLTYTLTWMIFQEVVREIYEEWEKRGSPHPIGYYHRDFIALGKEMYGGLYPEFEALWRATVYLKTLGIDRPFPVSRDRISPYSFPEHLYPHARYNDYPNIAEQHSHYVYKGQPIMRLAKDDWRREEYLASDGARHKLRQFPYGPLGHDW